MADSNALVTAVATLANDSVTNTILGLSDITEVTVPSTDAVSNTTNPDFTSRYFSLDSFSASEDASDLGYIRILKFTNGMFGSQVFPIVNGANSKYQNFIVTNTGSGMVEKAQIIKTNNTLQIYGFDSQVEVLNIQGFLKSTIQCPWDMGMIILWDELLRLTKLISLNCIAEFGYQSNVYWGYPLNFQWQKASNSQYLVSYSMQFIVVKRTLLAKTANQLTLANDITNQILNVPNIN